MPVHDLSPDERVPGDAEVVVCIPVYGAHDMFRRCLATVIAHTATDVPLLVADDADPDRGARRWVDRLSASGDLPHRLFWLRQLENRGFPGNVNSAFAAASRADVVVLNSDCEVAEGWLQGLRDAAYVDTLVATATALTNSGTIVSVPYRNIPMGSLPADTTFAEAAAGVRASSPRLRPRLPTTIGHCFWVRRSALDLVGDFDGAFAPGYGEEVDFSQRCLSMGLQHVLADDVLVLHHGGFSLAVDGESNPVQDTHDQVIRARYPWYEASVKTIEKDGYGPLSRSLVVARRALLKPTVTIDGRCLTPVVTGTQVNVLEFIHALWATDAARIRVITPPDLGEYAREAICGLSGVDLRPSKAVTKLTPRDDVVHRPFQVSSEGDLEFLNYLGERLVITHLDLISYRNPSYFRVHREWQHYRRLTRQALNIADMVFFTTRHAADDALADALVSPERTRVVPLGTDHHLGSLPPAPKAPAVAEELSRKPFFLCLGTDFRHKNRLFALRVFHALRERHGWEGRLVLAGPRVEHGSSAGDEAAWELQHRNTSAEVVRLPVVEEGEKLWLLQHAAALIYPTTYEGFGFVPFEASAAGLPCFFAHISSLGETLKQATAVVSPWNAEETADRAIQYLRDPARAKALVDEIQACAGRYRWEGTARAALAAYEDAVRMPAPPGAIAARDGLQAAGELRELEGRYWHLWNEIGPTGLSLVGPDGTLPDEAQRALSALARRRSTRSPLLAALRMASRIGGGAPGNGSPPPRPATAGLERALERDVHAPDDPLDG